MDKKVELFREYMEHLFVGRRFHARQLIFDAHERGFNAEKLLTQVIWPAMEQIDKLFREEHIPELVANMAVRINRMVADQLHAVLNRCPKNGRRVVVACGDTQLADLGGQILSDLFENEGWIVQFIGPIVDTDQIIKFFDRSDAHMFVIYDVKEKQLPAIGRLLNRMRHTEKLDSLQIMGCGGAFPDMGKAADKLGLDYCVTGVKDAIATAYTSISDDPDAFKSPSNRSKPKIRRKKTSSQDLKFESASRD